MTTTQPAARRPRYAPVVVVELCGCETVTSPSHGRETVGPCREHQKIGEATCSEQSA